MKSGRHEKILSIISEHSVETQDDLLKRLREEGFKATQATISRDIKELRIVKTLGGDGKYRYVAAAENGGESRSDFIQLFIGSVISIDFAQNIVVIKTRSGTANAVCASLDSTDNTSVVGTIAGDDTIFIACRTAEAAKAYCDYLRQYVIAR